MADNVSFKDAAGTTQTLSAREESAGIYSPRHTLRVSGSDLSSSNPLPAYPVATTTGGATPYKLISAASTNATSVKASAGQLYGVQIGNANAAIRFVKLYDKASSPTVGTDTPIKVILVPANGSVEISVPTGIVFSNGIALATTTGMADTDTGAVAANDLAINLDYK